MQYSPEMIKAAFDSMTEETRIMMLEIIIGLEGEAEEDRRTILRLEDQYGVILNDRNNLRKEICELTCAYEADVYGNIDLTEEQIAKRNGWDCYEESGMGDLFE